MPDITIAENTMYKFLWLCCGLLSMTCQADSEQNITLRQFIGIWQGSGKQDNNSNWTIKATINPDHYLIDYPSLNCGGTLELIKENDTSLVFREVLTYGLNGCYNHGKTVLIKVTDDTLRYYWYHENGGRKAAAGKLTRQTVSEQHSQQK